MIAQLERSGFLQIYRTTIHTSLGLLDFNCSYLRGDCGIADYTELNSGVHLLRERTEAVKCIDSILRQLNLWERGDSLRSAIPAAQD